MLLWSSSNVSWSAVPLRFSFRTVAFVVQLDSAAIAVLFSR